MFIAIIVFGILAALLGITWWCSNVNYGVYEDVWGVLAIVAAAACLWALFFGYIPEQTSEHTAEQHIATYVTSLTNDDVTVIGTAYYTNGEWYANLRDNAMPACVGVGEFKVSNDSTENVLLTDATGCTAHSFLS
jgi:hypothetical protein